MAHAARRKIGELHAVRPNAVTEEALRRIGALYRIEEQIRGKPPDERRSVRQARAVPLLDDMKRWFEATLATLSRRSPTRPKRFAMRSIAGRRSSTTAPMDVRRSTT
ncbi:dsRNA-specific ribonuclease [Paraburkholderia sp. MM5477-R1]